jgi:hypothetical protein
MIKGDPNDPHVTFLEVARHSTHSAREEVVRYEQPYTSEGPLSITLPPDEHVMVIDVAYFMSELQPWEWVEEYFAPWRVAMHCRWTKKILDLVNRYLMRVLDVERAEDIAKVRMCV